MPGPAFVPVSHAPSSAREIPVGIIGYGFMGRTHANAYRKIPSAFEHPGSWPVVRAMCGRDAARAEAVARSLGIPGYYTDARELIEDPDIEVVDICSSDAAHYAQSKEALIAGKHVACEKPLSRTLDEAAELAQLTRSASSKTMTMFNYRFIPAVRLAKELVEGGRLGTIYQFRGRYLQDQGRSPTTEIENVWYARERGSGVMLGIGCHIIDLARFLVGEPAAVSCMSRTAIPKRPSVSGGLADVTADDHNVAIVEFVNGAIGTIESSCISTGRKNQNIFEINGSEGSLWFDLEDLDHLHVCLPEEQGEDMAGFSRISVTKPSDSLTTRLLPKGHNRGWEYGHLFALSHFLDSIVEGTGVEPLGATFIDGYRVAVIMESMFRASRERREIGIAFDF